MKPPLSFFLALATALTLGCSSNGSSSTEEAPQITVSEDGVVRLVINAGDQMSYDKELLYAKANTPVELTLNHTGRLPKEAMGHNFIILKPGTDAAEFAGRAVAAGANDFIPEGDQIIAHTKMLGGGESDTITFSAPAAGTYEFMCSFPGHFGLMRGKFIVIE